MINPHYNEDDEEEKDCKEVLKKEGFRNPDAYDDIKSLLD
jgi:hypothetical protein